MFSPGEGAGTNTQEQKPKLAACFDLCCSHICQPRGRWRNVLFQPGHCSAGAKDPTSGGRAGESRRGSQTQPPGYGAAVSPSQGTANIHRLVDVTTCQHFPLTPPTCSPPPSLGSGVKHSQLLRLGFKPCHLIKRIIRAGSGDPAPSLGCWGRV